MQNNLLRANKNIAWKKTTGNSYTESLEIHLGPYINSLNSLGEYYYILKDLRRSTHDVVSDNLKKLTGYNPKEFTVNFLKDKIHPEDQSDYLKNEAQSKDFLINLPLKKIIRYKVQHNFKLRKSDGDYIDILQQSMVIRHDLKGISLKFLSVHTDISYLKTSEKLNLTLVSLDNEPSHINVDTKNKTAREPLSKCEKRVLILITEGKVSKEIGEILHISKQTVDTHRNNMMRKSNVKNTSELITKAIKSGWI